MKTLPLVLLFTCASACSVSEATDTQQSAPWTTTSNSWRTDAAWYDGLAEKCVYEATRTIYGTERQYLATAYTNKQWMDPKTTTKANEAKGVEVFKHHWSERIETENYDYDFSTASFTRCDDLAPFKLAVSTQEDCGTSFKQVWREGGEAHWMESVYFPDGGLRQGTLASAAFQPTDALTLILRDFPFGETDAIPLSVLASQKDTHRVSFEFASREVRSLGTETLELPAGKVGAEHLQLVDEGGRVLADYWFASETAAPWLHALVQYRDATGVSYKLASLERTAYWER